MDKNQSTKHASSLETAFSPWLTPVSADEQLFLFLPQDPSRPKASATPPLGLSASKVSEASRAAPRSHKKLLFVSPRAWAKSGALRPRRLLVRASDVLAAQCSGRSLLHGLLLPPSASSHSGSQPKTPSRPLCSPRPLPALGQASDSRLWLLFKAIQPAWGAAELGETSGTGQLQTVCKALKAKQSKTKQQNNSSQLNPFFKHLKGLFYKGVPKLFMILRLSYFPWRRVSDASGHRLLKFPALQVALKVPRVTELRLKKKKKNRNGEATP